MKNENKLIIERLTALWALNECGLGGFMHAFSSPFTGIVVGGISILLITLIAQHSKNLRSTLLKALTIVLLVKLSVSPHSPVTAYFAVSFQAFLGMVLYHVFSVNRFTIVLLGMITFLESALQKLLTLTIIYGESLWDAIEVYTTWISNQLSILELNLSAKALSIAFVTFYAFAGILVGFLIIRIIGLMQTVESSQINDIPIAIDSTSKHKTSKRGSKKVLLFWSITLLVIMLPLLFFKTEYGGWETALYLVARSLLIIGLWYIVLGPLLLKGLNKILSKRQNTYQSEIQSTLDLLPHLKFIIKYAWQDSKSLKGLNRMQHFLAKSIVYSIHFNPSKR